MTEKSRLLRRRATAPAALVLLGALAAGCGQAGSGGLQLPPVGFAADAGQGQRLFSQRCASCHGPDARGPARGPPLLHDYYRPGHHGDVSFYMAVQNGVRQHHWHFGDMAPVPGVSPEQVAHIVAWVRAQQRAAGIR